MATRVQAISAFAYVSCRSVELDSCQGEACLTGKLAAYADLLEKGKPALYACKPVESAAWVCTTPQRLLSLQNPASKRSVYLFHNRPASTLEALLRPTPPAPKMGARSDTRKATPQPQRLTLRSAQPLARKRRNHRLQLWTRTQNPWF